MHSSELDLHQVVYIGHKITADDPTREKWVPHLSHP
jgi:hypothetical protein